MLRTSKIAAIALPLSLLIACSPAEQAPAETPAPEFQAPKRIVSLNGTITEIIAGIGHEKDLVGVDVTSTWPASVNALPKVGHDRSIKTEGVISLDPDLVIGGKHQLDAATLGQLTGVGERVELFEQAFNIEGAKRLINEVAALFGRADSAAAMVARLDADLARVQVIESAPKVLFIYARGNGAMMVAGNGTPMQAMIELAGGRNAVSDFDQFKPLTPEALVEADPDAILLFDSGLDALQGPEGLAKVPGMAITKAGKNKAFITMDGGKLTAFGPRTGEALVELNTAFRALAQP